jgi:hypothetical protein
MGLNQIKKIFHSKEKINRDNPYNERKKSLPTIHVAEDLYPKYLENSKTGQ